MTEAKDILNAPSQREAIRRFKVWKGKWQVEEERAVRCLEKDFYHCLHYSFPEELWKKIRTTNLLERAFQGYGEGQGPWGSFPTKRVLNGYFME
jgi:transposase-like protein